MLFLTSEQKKGNNINIEVYIYIFINIKHFIATVGLRKYALTRKEKKDVHN